MKHTLFSLSLLLQKSLNAFKVFHSNFDTKSCARCFQIEDIVNISSLRARAKFFWFDFIAIVTVVSRPLAVNVCNLLECVITLLCVREHH